MAFYRLIDVMALSKVKPEYKLTLFGNKMTCSSVEDSDAALLQKYPVQ